MKKKSQIKVTHKRVEAIFYATACGFLIVGGRLAWMQLMPHASATALSDEAFHKAETLPARRGAILASDNTAIAVTVDQYTVAANPRAYSGEEKDRLADVLAQTVEGNRAEIRAALDETEYPDGRKKFYVVLVRGVDEVHIQKLRLLMGPQKGEKRAQRVARKAFWANVSIAASPRRDYPLRAFAPQLIGFTTNSGQGADGAEKAWNEWLGGENGIRESLVDAQGRAVPGTVRTWRDPVDGNSVVTTIDPKIQAVADATMKDVFEKFRPNFCVAVVMRPQTGEIVAVSTAPHFDLNSRPKNIVEIATNRAFNYNYEPGSTWKIVTAAAVVENVPGWNSKRFYNNGTIKAGKHTIHDWQFWSGKVQAGTKGFSDGFRDSSNVAMYHFANMMPRQTLVDYARKFGVGERPELPGFNVSGGYISRQNPREWPAVQYASFAFGQSMMITPLQLAQIGSVVANGGDLMKPMLVREVRDPRGKVIKKFEPQVHRKGVIRPETAREVGKMMRRVVSEGTAKRFIFVPGYAATGKTGSAQKAEGKNGYRGRKFISSFIGFLPQEKPEFVVAIMADEPKASHWGSETCGPAFTKIAEEAMFALRLQKGADAPKPNPALMVRKED